MPARTVRCLLSNQTPFPLVHESDDLSHGEYTGSWLPPQQVQPGQIVEWRSESDGIMTGTEGHAKYSINLPDSGVGHKEFLDVWWDNPYVGLNSADHAVTNDFGGTPSTDLQGGHFIQSGGIPPNAQKVWDLDIEAWLDTLLFIPYIVANEVSYNDTNAFFGIRMNAPPQFLGDFPGPRTGKRSEKVNLRADAAEWAGQWVSDGVSVTLFDASATRKPSHNGVSKMTVNITDTSLSPALQFTQDFFLGSLSWVASQNLVTGVSQELAGGSAAAKKFLALTTAKTLNGLNSSKGSAAADRFHDIVRTSSQESGTRLSATSMRQASRAISSIVGSSLGTVSLLNGVYLTLYDVLIDNVKQSQVLYYERHGVAGTILESTRLDFVPLVR